MRAEGLDEGQPLRPDVDADDLVAEGAGDLDGVVAQPAGGADHGDAPTGEDVVLEQLLDRAVRREAAAGQRGLLVAHAVGQLHQRLGVDAELLREGAHDALGLGAVPGVAAQAVLAGAAPVAAAGAPEPEDDAVADRDVAVGARAELGDDADALVAERHAARQPSQSPRTMCRSEWHTPADLIRISASSYLGVGEGRSWIWISP